MSLIRLVPDTLLKLLKLVSTHETRYLSNVRNMAKRLGQKAYIKSMGEDNEDLVEVLGRACASGQMDHGEVEAQIITFIAAGHEPTATTLAWLLFELAAHPEDQNELREEILQGRLQNGKLSSTTYDSMTFLNATMKEALRLHPIAHTLRRRTIQEECLPLFEPIIGKDGKVLECITIPKGQTLFCSIYQYNRLPGIWGSDAGQWNPNRFIDDRAKPKAPLGLYANLLSFGSGTRSCIGWQFAIMEMQVVVVDLLTHFQFSLPEDLKLQEFPAGPIIVPVVEGKASEGCQVPLRVSLLE